MSLNYRILLGTITLLILPLCTMAHEPQNLQVSKQIVMKYHDSGHYARDINAITRKGIRYIKHRVHKNKQSIRPRKLAIVLDIDETALSNYKHLKRLGFGGVQKQFTYLEKLATDTPIKGVRNLYNVAKKNGVAVFLVTGRRPTELRATIKNLKAAGYRGWNRLILRPKHYMFKSVIPYKTMIRKRITRAGYDIILNVGDQWSDLKGGYADKSLKIPNPYYYIP